MGEIRLGDGSLDFRLFLLLLCNRSQMRADGGIFHVRQLRLQRICGALRNSARRGLAGRKKIEDNEKENPGRNPAGLSLRK